MEYLSTRGLAAGLSDLESVLLGGLARDGGLHMPATWPTFSAAELWSMADQPYEIVAFRVIRPFLGGAPGERELSDALGDAYASFDTRERVPLVRMGERRWLLELHHGPTLSFKDIAMQLISRLLDAALARRSGRAAMICATSGDTGSAAIEAFRGRERIAAWVLYPEGRVSDVQRRQMTAPAGRNAHALAVRGDFDDCQALVKTAFNDHAFRDSQNLVAVNSINWGRIIAQSAYYFHAGLRAGALERPVSFVVPSGNFGNAFAGYAAARMGLPVERIVIAANCNDILHRIISSGRGVREPVVPTDSPSMDIQAASNFERILFDLSDGDARQVRAWTEGFARNGILELGEPQHARLRKHFDSASASDEECCAEMRGAFERHGLAIDPHTATAFRAAERCVAPGSPAVILATAHPAKFPEAVERAVGTRPAVPPRLEAVLAAQECLEVVDNDYAALKARMQQGDKG